MSREERSQTYGKDSSSKRGRYEDKDYEHKKGGDRDYGNRANGRRDTPRRDEERRSDRREHRDDRRSDRRDYDSDRRRDRGRDRDQDNDRRRERRRDQEKDREGNRDIEYADRGGRRRESSRERPGPSRRSASPERRPARPPSGSGSRSKSPVDKAKPNFNPSGLLAAATNTVKATDGTSTVLKYNEPPEARKPTFGWRLYVFKGSEQIELLHIHRQSAYLIGRDRTVADIFIEHPSCSKQHAVIQHRQVKEKDEFGGSKAVVKPFIIDLESTNATHVNDQAIPTTRFYELKAGDVIKFGLSNREYVLLHDDAA